MGADEQYSLLIKSFGDGDQQETTKIFETVFVKQKPNLLSMMLRYMKLFPNPFSLFTEKRWEKLNEINFRKCSFIQFILTSMINVLNFSQSVKCLLWKNWKLNIAQ